ncbi:MAG: RnfABCDGE type electron transport complex subunit G [Bacteroidales bacterium]
MAKKESTFTSMVLTLVIITTIASFVLATVYNLTAEPIAKSRQAKRTNAIREVLPAFDSLRTTNYLPQTGEDSLEFNFAYQRDELVGIAISTYTKKGYSGEIRAMVGFQPDGTIIDVVALQHAETPGLGDKIEKGKSDWSDQFKGKNPENFDLSVKKDNGDVDAITAATITSRAYCDAISRAYNTYMEKISKQNQEGEPIL